MSNRIFKRKLTSFGGAVPHGICKISFRLKPKYEGRLGNVVFSACDDFIKRYQQLSTICIGFVLLQGHVIFKPVHFSIIFISYVFYCTAGRYIHEFNLFLPILRMQQDFAPTIKFSRIMLMHMLQPFKYSSNIHYLLLYLSAAAHKSVFVIHCHSIWLQYKDRPSHPVALVFIGAS